LTEFDAFSIAAMNGNLAHIVTPSIFPLVNDLIKNVRIGICSGTIRVSEVLTGCTSLARPPNGDRFRILIPYACQSLIWDVIFIGNNADHPPDFNFDDKTFFSDPRSLAALGSWRKDRAESLRFLIEELLDKYRNHQLSQIKEYSRIQFEFSSLVENGHVTENDIEICKRMKQGQNTVNFLIKLPVNFCKLPPIFYNGNPGEDSAVLLATFHSPESTRISTQLFLSPRVEQALGGATNLKIPPFTSGGCLLDYVPTLIKLLQNKVLQIERGFEKRKEYTAAFLSYFGSSLLEFNSQTFSNLHFSFDINDFYFLLRIEIPALFPEDKPILHFQSIYHMCRGKPYTSSWHDYPYSPRWSGEEMAERTRIYILENIRRFQTASLRFCSRV